MGFVEHQNTKIRTHRWTHFQQNLCADHPHHQIEISARNASQEEKTHPIRRRCGNWKNTSHQGLLGYNQNWPSRIQNHQLLFFHWCCFPAERHRIYVGQKIGKDLWFSHEQNLDRLYWWPQHAFCGDLWNSDPHPTSETNHRLWKHFQQITTLGKKVHTRFTLLLLPQPQIWVFYCWLETAEKLLINYYVYSNWRHY